MGLLLLTGCGFTLTPIYNLNNFVIPDDNEFLVIVESLATPEEIVNYMDENFEWVLSLLWCYSPYQMWLANTKAGDCNDMSNFAVWVANYHGYETYQIRVFYEKEHIKHFLGVFVEDGKMNYSSNEKYYELQTLSFKTIAEDNCRRFRKELKKYKVYDYEMNIIEEYNG